MKTHVVVTIYTLPSATIVHAYGPYRKSRATRERLRIAAEHAVDVESGRLNVVACKIIDIDAMNAIVQIPTIPASRLA